MSRLLQKCLIGLGLAATLVSLSAAAEPTIISRKEWGAENAIERRDPPIQEVSSPTHPVIAENVIALRETAVYLTVHHAGADPDPREHPKARLKRQQTTWQSKRPGSYWIPIKNKQKKVIGRRTIYMADVPYHFVIAPAGQILEGRELKFAARSNTAYDQPISRHIAVVLEGDLQSHKPTNTQLTSLTGLLHSLAKQHSIKVNNVTHHRMVADSDCPGAHMIRLIPEIRRKLHSLGVPGDPAAPCDDCKPARIEEHKRVFGHNRF